MQVKPLSARLLLTLCRPGQHTLVSLGASLGVLPSSLHAPLRELVALGYVTKGPIVYTQHETPARRTRQYEATDEGRRKASEIMRGAGP